jgi:hypothetical protein
MANLQECGIDLPSYGRQELHVDVTDPLIKEYGCHGYCYCGQIL